MHMVNYIVVEISGKQMIVAPNKPFLVDYQGEDKKELSAKVLLKSEDQKITLGNPYLKDEAKFKVVSSEKLPKIRVAKFHAKANFRKVKGIRPKATKLVLS